MDDSFLNSVDELLGEGINLESEFLEIVDDVVSLLEVFGLAVVVEETVDDADVGLDLLALHVLVVLLCILNVIAVDEIVDKRNEGGRIDGVGLLLGLLEHLLGLLDVLDTTVVTDQSIANTTVPLAQVVDPLDSIIDTLQVDSILSNQVPRNVVQLNIESLEILHVSRVIFLESGEVFDDGIEGDDIRSQPLDNHLTVQLLHHVQLRMFAILGHKSVIKISGHSNLRLNNLFQQMLDFRDCQIKEF